MKNATKMRAFDGEKKKNGDCEKNVALSKKSEKGEKGKVFCSTFFPSFLFNLSRFSPDNLWRTRSLRPRFLQSASRRYCFASVVFRSTVLEHSLIVFFTTS